MASRHRKLLRYTTSVTVAGFVGAGLTGLAGINDVARADSHPSGSEVSAAAALHTALPGADDGETGARTESARRAGGDIPCDADALIQAIVRANQAGGGTLDLARHCTYALTRSLDGAGLPGITQPITINGNGATIARASGAGVPDFRILDVRSGGNLTLREVSVQYGVGTGFGDDSGGGGLLVRTGGRATVEDSTFVFNRSTGLGGAVANFGITAITGEARDGTYTSLVSNNSALGVGTAGLGGGGIYNNRYLTVENTRISYNEATGESGGLGGTTGGGVESVEGLTQLENTSVDHNRATGSGGGLTAIAGATISLARSTVADNTSNVDGGGIYAFAQPEEPAAVYLADTTVRHNTAGQDGGGIFNSSSTLVADRSRINENTSLGDGGFGGGLLNEVDAGTVLRHSEVDLNAAIGSPDAIGGGIANQSRNPLRLIATRVTGNRANQAPGGIANFGPITVDDRSTITGNQPTNCQGSPQPVPHCFG